VKFKKDKDEANNSTNDILAYSKYDREHLRFVYHRIGLGLSLSKVNTDELTQFMKNNMSKEEIDDTHAYEDYSYFFYKGVFENLT
jgi:Na+-transporting NADH:ubiquinone oxidoreductase subunit NqrF